MADETARNNPTRSPVRAVRLSETVDRVSWGAIWAGAIIALGMEILLTLFGLFIGFGMYNWQAANPWSGISAWTTFWYLVTAGWSMFFGAWCAARLSGNPVREAGILHGFATWGLATIATIAIVLTGSGAILREGINVLAAATLTVAQTTPGAVVPAPVPHAGQMAQATANIISGLALRTFGGVLLGFITALFGGWMGRAHTVVVTAEETPVAPRLAA
jgi:hypothetical protein